MTTHTISKLDLNNLPALQDGERLITVTKDNVIRSLQSIKSTEDSFANEAYLAYYRQNEFKFYLLSAEQSVDYPHFTASIDEATDNMILRSADDSPERIKSIHRHLSFDEKILASLLKAADEIVSRHVSIKDFTTVTLALMKEMAGKIKELDPTSNLDTSVDAVETSVNEIARDRFGRYDWDDLNCGRLQLYWAAATAQKPQGNHDTPERIAEAVAYGNYAADYYYVLLAIRTRKSGVLQNRIEWRDDLDVQLLPTETELVFLVHKAIIEHALTAWVNVEHSEDDYEYRTDAFGRRTLVGISESGQAKADAVLAAAIPGGLAVYRNQAEPVDNTPDAR